MKNIATLQFIDAETGDDGLAVVRASARAVSLALSLRANGDTEVFLSKQDCRKLIAALEQATSDASR